mmetsp:Transcript_36060/g.84401  ORF Transcript_36060/g.84401 Transcript_36060/m.84401 type:complete len:220 (-) Transcript_36060:5255-5914(-)
MPSSHSHSPMVCIVMSPALGAPPSPDRKGFWYTGFLLTFCANPPPSVTLPPTCPPGFSNAFRVMFCTASSAAGGSSARLKPRSGLRRRSFLRCLTCIATPLPTPTATPAEAAATPMTTTVSEALVPSPSGVSSGGGSVWMAAHDTTLPGGRPLSCIVVGSFSVTSAHIDSSLPPGTVTWVSTRRRSRPSILVTDMISIAVASTPRLSTSDWITASFCPL